MDSSTNIAIVESKGRTAIRFVVAFCVVSTYIASCCLPAFYGEGGFMEDGTEIVGVVLLLFGWCEMSCQLLSWLANPLLLAGLLFYLAEKDGSASIFSAMSFAAAISLLAIVVPSGIRLIQPIAIVLSERTELRVGYLVWTMTPLLLFVFSSLSYMIRARRYGHLTHFNGHEYRW